jgi:hypothetical protein
MKTKTSIIPRQPVEHLIRIIRGQRVILDSDLAQVYGVPTKWLIEAVRRNLDRFPTDFVFQLASNEAEEFRCSRSQIATSNAQPLFLQGLAFHNAVATMEENQALTSQTERSKKGRGGRRTLSRAFTEHGAIMAAKVLN